MPETDTVSQPPEAKPGTLYVVATPIGNLGDLSERAIRILREVDVIACEDTRTSSKLLGHFQINTPTQSCHEHNEQARSESLVEKLKSGGSVALISDAGTPAVSDPGFRVVRACRKAGQPVCPIPGPSAAIAALSASGLPSDAFFFAGFLPPKSAARTRFLEEQRTVAHTLILYESRHRIMKFLDEIVSTLGSERLIAVARELTKLHETIQVGPAGEVREAVAQRSQKGEFVVLIAPEGYVL